MTQVGFCAFVLTLWAIMLEPMSGAIVKLDISPSTVNPGLTKSMTLRCAVERDALPSSASDIKGQGAAASETFVTHNIDITYAMSIIVTRLNSETGVNETVASVSTYDPASAKVDLDIVQVEGITHSSSSSREMGYLQLTWDHPLNQQSGNYTCEVFALTSVLHCESISLTVEVGQRAATVGDVALFLAGVDRYVDKLEQKVMDMEKEIAGLRSEAENKTQGQQDQIDSLITTTQTLSQLTGPHAGQNIQAGVIDCPYGSSSTSVLHQFEVAFQKTPRIILTISTLSFYSNSYMNQVKTVLDRSSTTEFMIICEGSRYRYTVAWIAFEDLAA